jgi:hypothetical protein
MGARKVAAGYREQLAAPPPADRRVLRQALAHLDRTTLVGKRDAALMLLGHAIASRGSELAPLDSPASFTELPNGGFRVRVYRKKRKRWQDVEVLPDPEPEMCTVAAVRDLVEWGYMGAEMKRPPSSCRPGARVRVHGQHARSWPHGGRHLPAREAGEARARRSRAAPDPRVHPPVNEPTG